MLPEISVSFTLRGDEFDPLDVTKALAIQPTRSWRKGDIVRGTILKKGSDAWSLSTTPMRDTDLPGLLRQLLNRLLPKKKLLLKICRLRSLCPSFEAVAYVDDQTPALSFEPEILSEIVGLGASLDLDIVLTELSGPNKPIGD